jgi:hypothetical protein
MKLLELVLTSLIRTLKNRIRSKLASLNFILPDQLIPYLVYDSTTNIHMMITKNCIDNITPWEHFMGRKINKNLDFRIFFGQYVQVPIAEINNSMTPRTSASIALMHTHNANRSVKFFDLNSKKVVTRDRWSEVELTQKIIDRINKIATSKKNQIGNSNLQITVSVNDRSVDDNTWKKFDHLSLCQSEVKELFQVEGM